jgi:hypothetical protein
VNSIFSRTEKTAANLSNNNVDSPRRKKKEKEKLEAQLIWADHLVIVHLLQPNMGRIGYTNSCLGSWDPYPLP